MDYQGYDINDALSLVPKLQRLLHCVRSGGFPVYYTRQGESVYTHIVN